MVILLHFVDIKVSRTVFYGMSAIYEVHSMNKVKYYLRSWQKKVFILTAAPELFIYRRVSVFPLYELTYKLRFVVANPFSANLKTIFH